MSDRSYPYHYESTALAKAPIDRVFAFLDDPKAMASHMGESSMMMMGSRMSIDVDADGGRVVGSRIRMDGRMMGISLSLEEAITERRIPTRKVWETLGAPRLRGSPSITTMSNGLETESTRPQSCYTAAEEAIGDRDDWAATPTCSAHSDSFYLPDFACRGRSRYVFLRIFGGTVTRAPFQICCPICARQRTR